MLKRIKVFIYSLIAFFISIRQEQTILKLDLHLGERLIGAVI